jgi:hypothetical protein
MLPRGFQGTILAALLAFTGGCAAIGSVIDDFTGADEVRRLREVGVAAPAEILRIWDTGTTVNEDPVVGLEVEVQPVAGEPFRAVIEKAWISRLAIPRYQPGAVIAVRYDPNDPSRAVVDEAAVPFHEPASDPPGTESGVSLSLRLCARATGNEDATAVFLVTGPDGSRHQAVRTAKAGDDGVCLRFPDDFGEAETVPGRYRYEIRINDQVARRGGFDLEE